MTDQKKQVELDNKLFEFYVKQNKVLVFPHFNKRSDDNKVTQVERAKAFFICLNFKIDNLNQILGYPQLLEKLCQIFSADQKNIQKIELAIMDGSFFKDTSFKDIHTFLKDLTDKSLIQRIDDAAREYEECLICMDKPSDSFSECGHTMCSGCFSCLENKTCPFCRNPIGQVYSKEEYLKIQTKKLEDEKKKKEESKDVIIEEKEEKKKVLKKLAIVTDVETFLQKRVSSLFSAGSGKLSAPNQAEIKLLLECRDSYIIKAVQGKLSSEELGAFTLGNLCLLQASPVPKFVFTKEGVEILKIVKKVINNPNRLLRFLAVLKGNEPDPKEAILLKYNNAFRTLIMEILDSFPHSPEVCEQMIKHTPIFKKLFKNIHAGEFKKFTNAQKLIVATRKKKSAFPEQSNSSTLERLFSKKDEKIIDFFKTQPGLFFRNVVRLCNTFEDKSKEICQLAEGIIPKMKPEQLLELDHLLNIPSQPDHTTFITKRGTMKFIEKKAPPKVNKTQEMIRDLVKNVLYKLPKVPKVTCTLLDQNLQDFIINKGPPQDPILSLNKVPSSRGTRVDLSEINKLKNVEFFLFTYWKNGSTRVDLDLSFFGLDDQFNWDSQYLCDFTCTNGFNRSVQHSGDITDAPRGASEYIKFNLDEVEKKNPKMKYLVMACLSFNSIAFEDMGEAFAGIAYKTPELKGDGPYESIVLDGCRLKGKTVMNLGACIDIKNKELIFMCINIAKKKGGSPNIRSDSKLLANIVKEFYSWRSSRSVPSSWYEIGLNCLTGYSSLLIKTNTGKLRYYEKDEKESQLEYYFRVQSGKKDNEIPKKLQQEIDGNIEKDSTSKWIVYGKFELKQIPKGSVVVSPFNIDDPEIQYLDDPFKLLHFKE